MLLNASECELRWPQKKQILQFKVFKYRNMDSSDQPDQKARIFGQLNCERSDNKSLNNERVIFNFE